MRRLHSLTGLSSLLVLCVAACGSDDDDTTSKPTTQQPADEISFELFASTKQLSEADLALVTNIEPAGRITFASEPPGLAGVAEGTIFIGGITPKTPQGLLRFVTGVDRSNGGFALQTTAAPLQAAFKKLHAKAQRKGEPFVPGLPPMEVKDVSPLSIRPQFSIAKGTGGVTQSYDIVIFDGDGDVGTTNDQVKVEATFGGGFVYEVALDIDWGFVDRLPETVSECIKAVAKIVTGQKPTCNPTDLLPEAKVSFRADPFLTLDAKASGAASLMYEKDIEVGVINLPPFALGPLVFTPAVDIIAHVEGGASARFEVGAHARADFKSSVVVSSKNAGRPVFNPPSLDDFDVRADKPVLDLHAKAEVSVGARLNAPLYGVAGPYATLSGVARINASPFENPCFKVTLGIETELGVRITTPRLPGIGYLTIADASTGPISLIDKEVASGACTIPPDPPRPPGGGPTPTTLQQPAFTPWAKVIGGADIDGVAAASISSFGWPDLTPSIDGRYLLAGESALALHKIDRDGNATWLTRLGEPPPAPLTRRNRVLRAVPATNGEILALLRPENTSAFALAKIGQSGALDWSREYISPGADACDPIVTGLFKDPGRGYVVIGQCRPNRGFIVRVDEAGEVVRARVLAEAGSRLAKPTVATTTTDGEFVIVGEVAVDGDLEWTFVSRLDADDRPTGASTAFRCPERIVAQPTAVIPAEQGGITVVGTANGLGMIARVRKDNSLGFVKYPNIGVGVASSMVVTSVQELSTTGMVIGANAGNVSQAPTHWVMLAGLDSGGSTLWARRYFLPADPITFPSLRLTDDGGIFVSAISSSMNGQVGTAYAMKVFAKDGFLGEGQPLTSESVTVSDFTCATATRAFSPTVTDFALTSQPSTIKRL
jgi:hypothetical protein